MGKWTDDTINTRNKARETLIKDWQTRWDSSSKGRWTNRLIKKIEMGYSRKHEEMSYHLTQALTGHGFFAYFLHKKGKTLTPGCRYCDSPLDDALNTLFKVAPFQNKTTTQSRRTHQSGLYPLNNAEEQKNWATVWEFTRAILSKKKDEERRL